MQSAMYLIPELAPIAMAMGVLRARLDAAKEREAGYTTETVVVTGLLAAAAMPFYDEEPDAIGERPGC